MDDRLSLGEQLHRPAGCHRNGLPHPGPCLVGPLPFFTCPDCRVTSDHPDDVADSYCYHCHQFKNESWQRPRCMEPTCENFGDHDFGEASCPEFHADPPALRSAT